MPPHGFFSKLTYDAPVIVAICATTTARKLFRPMPGAKQNGLFARKAMQIMAMPDAKHVARKTAFQSSSPPARQPVSKFGFRAMMYAIVMNVVRPAMISVLTDVPFSLSLNSDSNSISSRGLPLIRQKPLYFNKTATNLGKTRK